MRRYTGSVTTGMQGAEREFEFQVDEEDLKGLSEDEKERFLNKMAWERVLELIDYGYKEEETK